VKRFLRVYLLCIVLPALAVAWGGLRLLRIDARNRAAIVADYRRLMAERCAEDFLESVRELLDPFLDRLAAAPDSDGCLAALRDLARNEPAVRAAFLWREGEGCVWPRRIGCTEEERRFLNRYEPLFSGTVPWIVPATGANPGSAPSAAPVRGFRPWASGDRSDLLAWVRVAPGEIAGFELETMWLLSGTSDYWRSILAGIRLRKTWLRSDRTAMPHASGEILDESGTILVPSYYELAEASDLDPAAEVALAPFFPRWRLRIRSTAKSLPFDRWTPDSVLDGLLDAPATRRALGAALLALVLLSLVSGGYVLLRAARRERLDALRKTDFVDNVSHELKTPLAGIRLEAELLAEGRLPDGPRRDRALRSILSESDRLERLVSNLLDFGRLERGRRKFVLQSVDLATLLAEMQNAQCTMHNGDGDIVHCAFGIVHCERGFAALADPDAVRQIVLNLLDNAAKYAPGAPPEVSVRATGNGVELVVADRGPGVPRGLEEKVFERFFRADDALARGTNGSGLGLSIARGLARGMGGDLTCRPREGGGAEFVLTLPKG
jgi:signal transduction histidine kinase